MMNNFVAFRQQLCSAVHGATEMVEYKICFLTSVALHSFSVILPILP